MQLGAGRSGVTCLGLDNQPEGVRSVDAKNHSRWLLGNYLDVDATKAARSDVTGLGLEKQPKVALGELS
jgi:hypothetical protein